jgi:DNA-binding LytR/AlgR family response regulator
MFPPTILTWVAINAPRILNLNFSNISHNKKVQSTSLEETPNDKKQFNSVSKNEFLAKFSDEIGTDIIYLVSEWHYIRVVTSKGEMLILHNLKDAISELPSDLIGIQTHRSFWVSLKYIDSISEKKPQCLLMLSNGNSIPVSRRRLGLVKDFLEKNRGITC